MTQVSPRIIYNKDYVLCIKGVIRIDTRIIFLIKIYIKTIDTDISMMTVSCRDVGVDCDYVAKGETEEEIMRDAGEHAVRDHGYNKEEHDSTDEGQNQVT